MGEETKIEEVERERAVSELVQYAREKIIFLGIPVKESEFNEARGPFYYFNETWFPNITFRLETGDRFGFYSLYNYNPRENREISSGDYTAPHFTVGLCSTKNFRNFHRYSLAEQYFTEAYKILTGKSSLNEVDRLDTDYSCILCCGIQEDKNRIDRAVDFVRSYHEFFQDGEVLDWLNRREKLLCVANSWVNFVKSLGTRAEELNGAYRSHMINSLARRLK